MKKLLLGLKKYIGLCIMAPFLKLCESALDLVVPIIVQRTIDIGIASSDTAYIFKMCMYLVGVAVFGLIFSVLAQYFAAKAAVSFVTDARHNLYEHIRKFSYKDLDRIGTSTLITRMTSDMNQVQDGVNICLRLLLRAPFIVIGSCVIAYTIDKKISLIFIVSVIILFAIVFAIMLKLNPLYKKTQENLDDVTLLASEGLSGVRTIRALNIQDRQAREFGDKTDSLFNVQKKTGIISALLHPLTFVTINIAIIILLYSGAIRVNSGTLTQGNVVALYNLISQILTELIKCARFIMKVSRAVTCANRIQSVMDIEPSIGDNSTCGVSDDKDKARRIPQAELVEPSIGDNLNSNCEAISTIPNSDISVEFDTVSMNYLENGIESENALTDISFSAKRGEWIGIIGGTGSGKTTLVNLIERFYDVSSGSVKVDGVDVRVYSEKSLREKIAIVPQKAVLFEGTVRENLAFGSSGASDEQMMGALKTAQGLDIIAAKENGLDSVVEQDGRNFSGGQRQRLTIARALMRKDAEILILDDSSSALDMATDRELRRAIKADSDNKTVFIISQRTSSVMNCDKIIVLDDGKCVGMGTHDELLEKCSVYREIFNCKLKENS